MTRKLWGDLETFSEVPITHGTYAYAAAAEVMLFAWAIDEGPVSVWDATAGGPMPAELAAAFAAMKGVPCVLEQLLPLQLELLAQYLHFLKPSCCFLQLR